MARVPWPRTSFFNKERLGGFLRQELSDPELAEELTNALSRFSDLHGREMEANWLSIGDHEHPTEEGVSLVGILNKTCSSPGTNPRGMTWDGSHIWVVDAGTNTIDKIDSACAVIDSITAAGPAGLTWDGTHFWNSKFDTIYRLDTAGTVVQSFAAPGTGAEGLAWDGTHLWHTDVNTDLIYRLDPADGSVLQSFDSPDQHGRSATNVACGGLTWDGTHLWCCDRGSDRIYRLDPSDGRVLQYFASSSTLPRGMAWDGTYLWHSDDNTDLLYRME